MLWIKTDMVNLDKGYRFGDDKPHETCYDKPGELYRALMREYGRCAGKMYIDRKEGGAPKCIGWVFIKRAQYDDCNKSYLQETWVAVVDGPEVITRKVNYVEVA